MLSIKQICSALNMKQKQRVTLLWNEYRGLILFIILMSVIRSAIADWNTVPSGSMQPTIVEGDRILVNKLAYDLSLPFTNTSLFKLADPERGDIIIFDSEVSKIRLVKRVIGIPGDVISMRDNVLTINQQELTYSASNKSINYEDLSENLLGFEHMIRVKTKGSRSSSFQSLLIHSDLYLVLGDNRDNSADSRYIGLVPRKEIIGRTRSVVMSFDYDDYYIPRKNRFFHTL